MTVTEIMSRSTQAEVEGPAQWFTGRVTIRGQFARDEPSRVTGAIVTFEPGARTAWHSHPLGQTLIVTDGIGWTQVEDDPVREFAAGDILLCPRNRRHFGLSLRWARIVEQFLILLLHPIQFKRERL